MISPHSLLLFLVQVTALLLLASLLGRLAVRLGLAAVVGELCAGVVLGPSVLGQVAPGAKQWLFPAPSSHMLDAIGQLGMLLLIGLTGAHLDPRLIRRQGAAATRVSAFGLLVPMAFGAGAGLALPAEFRGTGEPVVFALFLGVAMCVSAIPVIAKMLMDMNLLHRNVSQLTLTAGMIDDALGWVLLSVVTAMATAAGAGAGTVMLSIASLAGVIVAGLVIGRPAVRMVLRTTRDPGVTAGQVVVLVLAAAAGTHALGLKPAFGAFVAGVLVSTAMPDPARLAPLRTVTLGVLAPLYFATMGLHSDLTALARPEVLAVGLLILALAITGKFLGAFLGAWTSGLSRWEALALGAGMNARGVIQMIVATVGLRLGVITAEIFTIIIVVAVLTSLIAPPLLRLAMTRIEATAEEEARLLTYGLRPSAAGDDMR